jgi:hypothetical protein
MSPAEGKNMRLRILKLVTEPQLGPRVVGAKIGAMLVFGSNKFSVKKSGAQ